jgi:hypothetical protein
MTGPPIDDSDKELRPCVEDKQSLLLRTNCTLPHLHDEQPCSARKAHRGNIALCQASNLRSARDIRNFTSVACPSCILARM